MRTPSVEQVVKALEIKGHKVFRSPLGYDLNIVGIRAKEAESVRFDDLIVVLHRQAGHWNYNVFPATTDPGRFWLEHPMAKNGTAILKPGQYRGAYKIGKHQGKYEALVQHRELTVIRDNNKDARLDTEAGAEETGLFGINIHRASTWLEPSTVDRWSAGCQVIGNPWDFEVFMALCRAGAAAFGNSFTYTLITEADVFGIHR